MYQVVPSPQVTEYKYMYKASVPYTIPESVQVMLEVSCYKYCDLIGQLEVHYRPLQ